jgi:hypothetical protein
MGYSNGPTATGPVQGVYTLALASLAAIVIDNIKKPGERT